jgi:hypothetical protein
MCVCEKESVIHVHTRTLSFSLKYPSPATHARTTSSLFVLGKVLAETGSHSPTHPSTHVNTTQMHTHTHARTHTHTHPPTHTHSPPTKERRTTSSLYLAKCWRRRAKSCRKRFPTWSPSAFSGSLVLLDSRAPAMGWVCFLGGGVCEGVCRIGGGRVCVCVYV